MSGNWKLTATEVRTDNRPRGNPITADTWVYAMERDIRGDGVRDVLINGTSGDHHHERLDNDALVGYGFSYHHVREENQPPFIALGECHPVLKDFQGDLHTITDETLARAVIRLELPNLSPQELDEIIEEMGETDPGSPEFQIEPAEGFRLSASAQEAALRWMLDGETGSSSQAILHAALTGEIRTADGRHHDRAHPLDLGDLRRCILMLDAVPEARQGIQVLAQHSPKWERLAARWDELEQVMREDWKPGPAEPHGSDPPGRMHTGTQSPRQRAYLILREILGSWTGTPGQPAKTVGEMKTMTTGQAPEQFPEADSRYRFGGHTTQEVAAHYEILLESEKIEGIPGWDELPDHEKARLVGACRDAAEHDPAADLLDALHQAADWESSPGTA